MSDALSQRVVLLTERVHDLETRHTHLQRTVEDLNDVLIAQGKQIDGLERKLLMLIRRIDSLENPGGSLPHEKPPHY